ncbi:MAG: cysteine desulfurase family protein [Acidimicrobiia bacterium]
MSALPPLRYFDHAATTPMRPEAVEAMLPFLTERFANPSGSHRGARDARRALDEARDVVAEVLAVPAGGIVFTGCGTEADNAALSGTLRRRGGIAVCPAAEHHAVLHVVEHGGGRVVGVDAAGRVDLVALDAALDEHVSIVSVMAVNNEVGTVQPFTGVAELVRRRAPEAYLHTDAVQAACWLDLSELTPLVDLLAISAHKFGGPKGVGALWIRDGVQLEPLLQGGGQERDRRSGTHNVAGIVAMAEALRITAAQRVETNERVTRLRDRLVDGLLATCPGASETVERAAKVAGSAHLCFEGCENESLLFLLDQAGICASAASACASGAMEPSHVLAAMGVSTERARGAIRFSLGHTTTDDDIDVALAAIPPMIERLRGRS